MELSEKLKNLLEEFILTFNKYKVDYIAVGGVAVNHHDILELRSIRKNRPNDSKR
jgi:hypothetical protein